MTLDEMIMQEHRELGGVWMLTRLLDRVNLPDDVKQVIRLEGMAICAEGMPYITEPRQPTNPATLIAMDLA